MSRATVIPGNFPQTDALLERQSFSDFQGALTEAVDSRLRLLRAGVETLYEAFERNLS